MTVPAALYPRTIGAMHSPQRRVIRSMGLAAASLLLVGCNTTGTITVHADSTADFDLVVSGFPLSECPAQVNSMQLQFTPVQGSAPGVTCQVTGTIPLSQVSESTSLTPVEQYLVLTLQTSVGESDTVDVLVRMPGEIIESNHGQAAADGVRVVSASDLESGLRIVARNRPGPSDLVLGVAAGSVGTLLLLGVGLLLRRRRRDRVAALASDDPDLPGFPPPDPGTVPVTEADAPEWAWAPAPQAPEPELPVDDHSIWAPPSDGGSVGADR